MKERGNRTSRLREKIREDVRLIDALFYSASLFNYPIPF